MKHQNQKQIFGQCHVLDDAEGPGTPLKDFAIETSCLLHQGMTPAVG